MRKPPPTSASRVNYVSSKQGEAQTVHSGCSDERSYQVTSSKQLVRAPDQPQADRSFARHSANEEPSQTRNLSRTPQHYECEEPVNSWSVTRDTGAGPRYEVTKTYAQRGPMRQYRLTASTSFRCFRCGLAKTSKLVTVFRQDWHKLLCNGCYGRLLSLHDIRAESADDSKRADALAEQLLMFASADERRDAMELLRIRANRIDQLSDRSQRLLSTSEFVASHLANATGLDWSAAIVGICKAVEVELVKRLIEPLALECRYADLDRDIQDNDLRRIARFCAGRTDKAPELGVIHHFLQTARNSRHRQDTSPLLHALRQILRQWPDSDWLLESDGALVVLEQVTAQHRNRAVHTEALEESDFDACHQLVLGENGMLWELVRATKSRRQ